jgi:hypothetical protein
MTSTVDRLQPILNAVADRLASLIAVAKCEPRPRETGMFVFMRPDYSWRALSSEQQAEQIEIARSYAPTSELAKCLLRDVSEDLQKQLEKAPDIPDAAKPAMRGSANEGPGKRLSQCAPPEVLVVTHLATRSLHV